MPAAIPLLATIGGGSALAGGVALAGTAATLYGASKDRKAASQNQDQSAYERQQNLGFIQDAAGQAQNYLSNGYAPAQQAMSQGYGGASQALAGSFAPRMNAINQGGMDAQRFQLGALPFIQQALMGQSMDLSKLAPYVQKSQISYDPTMMTNLLQQYGPK